jgi:glycogen(starch) synthase
MGKIFKTKKPTFNRDIFTSGRYIQYFNPEDKSNPFLKIYRYKKQDTFDIIDGMVKPNKILDVGGGMGRLVLSLGKSERREVYLIDISIDMLKLFPGKTLRSSNIPLINSDAHDLPFPDNSFDLVVGLDLFCHLEDPEKALSEFYRVLTRQGMLILDSTNSNPLWTLFYPRYLGKNPLKWIKIMKFKGVCPGWQQIVKHYSKKKFFKFLQDAGFSVKRNINYGPRLCPKWHLAVASKQV